MSVPTRRSRAGLETSTSASTDLDGWYGDHPRGHRGQRLDPVAAAREHEQPVAVQKQLVARRRLERERVEQARLRAADVDRAQLSARDGEERVAVGLDHVGLVDALLLDVRARVVDALLGSGCARRLRWGGAPAARLCGRRSRRTRMGRRSASPAPWRSRAAGRRFRTRSASSCRRRPEPSEPLFPLRRRPRRPPAPRGARRVYRSSSPWLYATPAEFVTSRGVMFVPGGTKRVEGLSMGHERSTE